MSWSLSFSCLSWDMVWWQRTSCRGRSPNLSLRSEFRSLLHQQPHYLYVPPLHRQMEGSLLVDALDIRTGPLGEKGGGGGEGRREGGEGERASCRGRSPNLKESILLVFPWQLAGGSLTWAPYKLLTILSSLTHPLPLFFPPPHPPPHPLSSTLNPSFPLSFLSSLSPFPLLLPPSCPSLLPVLQWLCCGGVSGVWPCQEGGGSVAMWTRGNL